MSLARTVQLCMTGLLLGIAGAVFAQQTSIVADDGTNGMGFQDQTGKVLTFVCPSTLVLNQDIWGTDVYLEESAICKAAIHAGVLTRGTTGQVTIVMGGGAESFEGTSKNGVTSLGYGPGSSTYSFVANSQAGQIDWYTTFDLVPDDFPSQITVVCPPKGSTDTDIWGTDVYSASSAICPAAVHAGAITLESGGRVTLTLQPKQETFVASLRNGISSRGWSSWEYPYYPRAYKPTAGMMSTPVPVIRSEPTLSTTSPRIGIGTRILALAGFTATGTATPILPRTINLSGFTANGISASTGPRNITLAGFTGTGTATPIVPRTISTSGYSAIGTATPVVPRTIPVTGWNGTGAPTTP